jgi:hypothetical protein
MKERRYLILSHLSFNVLVLMAVVTSDTPRLELHQVHNGDRFM